MLGEELSGSSRVVALAAPSLAEARVEGAAEVLHAYYTREHGTVRLSAEIENRASLRVLPVAVSSGPLLGEIGELAHALDPAARPFSSSDPAAIEAWGRGDFARALELDPDFGAAWVGRVRMLAQLGSPAEALRAADGALARRTLRSDWSRAELRVAAATIRKDFAARASALTDMANLAPADPAALAAAAEAQSLARNFRASAELYRKLRMLMPADPAALNSLGYAEGYLGDVDAAKKVFEDYAKLPGNNVNAHDSLGEVYFINGRFREAEQEFRAATALDPNFLGGAPAMKAAYAHWLAGDLQGADAMVQQFVGSLIRSNPKLAIWHQATWLYATGRQEQAQSMLSRAPADERVRLQLDVWRNFSRLPSDVGTLRARYYATPPSFDGLQRVLYASALLEAGQEAEARTVLKNWPLPLSVRDPEFDSVIFAKYRELRIKAGLAN